MIPSNALPTAAPSLAGATARALTLVYGSQTGNGERIAIELAGQAREQGYFVDLINAADFKPAQLKRTSTLALVVSTHGEGDPPDDAELLYEYLMSGRAPRLDHLRFSVLALGDSSYPNFCETGREFDARLAALGAERIVPLAECDLDFESLAGQWSDTIVERLPTFVDAGPPVPRLRAVRTPARFDRRNPFSAEVLLNQRITGRGSSKSVHHLELSLEGSGIEYQPGDSVGVIASNPPQLVAEILDELGFDAQVTVTVDDEPIPLAEALRTVFEVTASSGAFLQAWAKLCTDSELADLVEDAARRSTLVDTHQVIDILQRYPANPAPQAFVDTLRRLAPRSYSIASGPDANPGEVHLTVGAVRYTAFGSERVGAASTYLAERVSAGDTVSLFPEPNTRFRLPDDDTADIIMIGPGTGVAPFRAFVEERAERRAPGRNWLFFGDRTFSEDFLYQREWQRHLADRRLHALDVAFSRDQDKKIYVQDRLRERGSDLWRWIDDGAYIYVCGDAKRMAADVHDALAEIVALHGGMDQAAAANYLADLRRSGRYRKDVY